MDDQPARQIEYVLRTVEERNIRFIRLWFTDVLGFLKSVAITPAELEHGFDAGIGFDGSAIEGFARVQESDMVARPDPSTFQILPPSTTADGFLEARMFCDVTMPDGAAFPGDPRWALRRMLEKASSRGFTFYVHPEMEFFLFKSAKDPVPLDTGSYFDLTPLDMAQDFRREAINRLEAMGISVEYSHHEVAPSQHEIDLRFADALTTADNIMTYRLIVKEAAAQRGMHATFMPKPLQGQWGSGMHTHVSLFEGETNAFYDRNGGLSVTGRRFVAGVLAHAREITAVLNQWVNSYKRLVPGYEAPVYVCWSHTLRSAFIRVPGAKPKKAASARVEIRSPDPACNPYLAFAVILAAGLDGIENKLDLMDEVGEDVDAMSADERGKRGIAALPGDLSEALREMERSELVAEALGEHIFERLLRNKRVEWDTYKAYVSPFELERYLPVL
ncbi:MAG: type I glutamate--ammonia ligase [Actinobacteria bacterium]|nr:type I glutamate--ammonia ligase [Actinomycetota bacterium]